MGQDARVSGIPGWWDEEWEDAVGLTKARELEGWEITPKAIWANDSVVVSRDSARSNNEVTVHRGGDHGLGAA